MEADFCIETLKRVLATGSCHIFNTDQGSQFTSKGYRYSEQRSGHGGIEQRWILIYSEQAYRRESKTFEKRVKKQEGEAKKLCWHVSNQLFNCESDARLELEKVRKKYAYLSIESDIVAIEKHKGKGRPKPGSQKHVAGYRLVFTITRNEAAIQRFLLRKGRFILATNILDIEELPSTKVLSSYKEQQSVENGFRFLKDPWFMVDTFYIKKRKRIEALMMIMTLCLLVYNFTQHKLRVVMENNNETLPNQISKQIKNPTLKWIFQLMEGVGIVKMFDKAGKCIRSLITNLNLVRKKIIRLLGGLTCEIYGIPLEIAGM